MQHGGISKISFCASEVDDRKLNEKQTEKVQSKCTNAQVTLVNMHSEVKKLSSSNTKSETSSVFYKSGTSISSNETDICADRQNKPLNNTSTIKKHGNIVLQPQPSDCPDDPLNWSRTHKVFHVLILLTNTLFTSATTNLGSVAQQGLEHDLGITIDIYNIATGLLFIGIGLSCFFLAPLSFLYGRKALFVFSIIVCTLGCTIFATTTSISGFLVSQFLIGVGESVSESQVPLSFSDVYFGHQIGIVISIYVFQMAIGNFIGPLLGGFIAEYHGPGGGWRWIGGWAAIFSVIMFFVLVFGLNETLFDRDQYNENLKRLERVKSLDSKSQFDEVDSQSEYSTFEQRPYFIGTEVRGSSSQISACAFKQYFNSLTLTLRVLLFPAVIYTGIVWGWQNAWMSFYTTTLIDDYSKNPYNFSPSSVGVMNLWCALRTLIGCIYSGPFSDKYMSWFSKRRINKIQTVIKQLNDTDSSLNDEQIKYKNSFGKRDIEELESDLKNDGVEPEIRLWQMILPMIISPLGFFIFGISSAKYWNINYAKLSLALIGFGWGSAGDINMSYLMDAYPQLVLESMIGVAVINNGIACIVTFVCQKWIDSLGTLRTYISVGVVAFFFLACFIIMLLFGKKFRRMTQKYHDSCIAMRDG